MPKHSQNHPETIQNSWKNHRKTLKNATSKHLAKKIGKHAKKCDLGANLAPTWPPKAKKNASSTGYATPSQRSCAPPKGMGRPEPNRPTHEGYETPAYCDAKRVGEAARGSLKRRYPPKIFPKFFQNAPEVLPRTSQEPPKPFPNQARSTHETKEAPKKRPRAPKKRQHGAQERPNGAQEPPQTFQNGGIECPRPNF